MNRSAGRQRAPDSARAARYARPSVLMLAIATALQAINAEASAPTDAVEFDRQALINRGLDPTLADLFREAPRFAPGRHTVAVTINGKPRGRVDARFDETGTLLADVGLLEALRLFVPDSIVGLSDAEAGFALQQAWPNAVVRADPGRQELHLVIPADAVDTREFLRGDFLEGGVAGMFNYDLGANTVRMHGVSRTTWSGSTEAGFNAGGWVVRSRQNISGDGVQQRLRVLDAYAQRSLPASRRLLQAGDVYVANPLFPGTSVTGVQLIPEPALAAIDAGPTSYVEGIASSEARVEIYQGGRLVHSTLVPAGPFSLGDFRPLDSLTDLEVVVHEQEGERRFRVPAARLTRAPLTQPGSTFAAGRLRSFQAGPGADSTFVSLSGAWRVAGSSAVVSAGAQSSEHLHALAIGVDAAASGTYKARLGLRSTGSMDTRRHVRGASHDLRLSIQRERISIDVGAARRTQGYRTLYDAPREHDRAGLGDRPKWELSGGAGMSSEALGAFGVTWSTRRNFNGGHNSGVAASWSRRIGRGTLALTLESRQSSTQWRRGNGRAIQASWSLPLDGGQLRGTVRQRDGARMVGVDMSRRMNPRFDWRASAVQQADGGEGPRLSAGGQWQGHQARVGLSGTHERRNSMVNASVSGGLVMHRRGVTFSPFKVQDTFGIVQVGDQAGVRLSTGAGDAWTDRHGRVVVPRLLPYADTRIQVDGRTLPRGMDLDNGSRTVRAARGAVSFTRMETKSRRGVLVQILDSNGQPLAKGAAVLRDGHYLTALVGLGQLFLDDYQPGGTLTIRGPDGSDCAITELQLATGGADAFFETGTAACLPLQAGQVREL